MIDNSTVTEIVKIAGHFTETCSLILRARYLPTAQAKGEIVAAKIRRDEQRRLLEEDAVHSLPARAELSRIVDSEFEQENLEAVLEIARPLMEDMSGTTPKEVWINTFRKGARAASEFELRTLWANVLAAESQEPDSVGVRTLKLMEALDKRDAHIFHDFMCVADKNGYIYKAHVKGEPAGFYLSYANLDYDSLVHLIDIGLISAQDQISIISQPENIGDKQIHYWRMLYNGFDISVHKTVPFNLTMVSFTNVGLDLMRALSPETNTGAVQQLLHYFINQKFTVILFTDKGPDLGKELTDEDIERLHELLDS